ncbi:MAG: STAS domain-containing protein [Chitinispirillales bacterium]|jgi:anti-anti-sigma factor|nr:STAS domain-containing protein [Chitinispirillales bacterium]
MELTKTQCGGKATFALSGRLDATAAPEFQAVLIPAFDEASLVELDLAALTYVSSAGLRVLLLGEKTAKSKGAAMPIRNVSQEIKEIFDMTGFSDILNIV